MVVEMMQQRWKMSKNNPDYGADCAPTHCIYPPRQLNSPFGCWMLAMWPISRTIAPNRAMNQPYSFSILSQGQGRSARSTIRWSSRLRAAVCFTAEPMGTVEPPLQRSPGAIIMSGSSVPGCSPMRPTSWTGSAVCIPKGRSGCWKSSIFYKRKILAALS